MAANAAMAMPISMSVLMALAAATYDGQEEDLITKTRKIIAASNRALPKLKHF